MRLGTCIAVEVLVGLSTLAGLGAGAAWAVGALTPAPAATHTAAVEPAAGRGVAPAPLRAPDAAPVVPVAPPVAPVPTLIDAGTPTGAAVPTTLPAAPSGPAPDAGAAWVAPELAVAPGAAVPAWNAGGRTDAEALAPLRTGAVTKVKFNRGGSSLSLRLDFDNGARAAFKPEQVHPQSNPRREIAAYRLDRLLGLNRVPPAIGRALTVEEVRAAVPPSERGKTVRIADEAIARGDQLRGELSWWIPVIADGKVDGFQIDSTDGIVTWKRWLRAGGKIPDAHRALVAQISDMIVFDFLVDNTDRWTGNNAKVSEDGAVLYFMDNTMAFTANKRGHRKSHTYLGRVQTFSRRLIDRIRALTEDEVRGVMARDHAPFPRLLTDAEVSALMARRDLLLTYVDDLIAEHGADVVLALP